MRCNQKRTDDTEMSKISEILPKAGLPKAGPPQVGRKVGMMREGALESKARLLRVMKGGFGGCL